MHFGVFVPSFVRPIPSVCLSVRKHCENGER